MDAAPSVRFPRMMAVRQNSPVTPPLDIMATVGRELETSGILSRLGPGARVAVGVGSRGITNLARIVTAVIDCLKAAGANPFIIPAMGSHGGATPEGQTGILADYGVTEKSMGVSIRASLEVQWIGKSEHGVEVFLSKEALNADGILLINRVKPHTDFRNTLGSGIMKMIAIGLGKQAGAATCHRAAGRIGFQPVLTGNARVALGQARILGGVAIVEDQHHQTARIALLKADEIEAREAELLMEATRLLPRLPFDDIDLLIVDRIGKNISGTGMDPNVIGRWVHGYSTFLGDDTRVKPRIRRIFVRELTPESHGNAVGIGLADLTTTRLVNAMDKRISYVNSLTALTLGLVKIPIHFDTDQECVAQALMSLALPDTAQAKVIRIRDTLSLLDLEVSEAYAGAVAERSDLDSRGSKFEMSLDAQGNLASLRSGGF